MLLSLAALALPAQEPSATQTVNSKISATLHDRDKTIDGYIQTEYINNANDTLHFIWFRLAPNAFKNDRTAFSEYLLRNDRTDFYFAKDNKKGYINRLDFRTNDEPLTIEDHPLYIDLVKVTLPAPLPPRGSITISTPFHVKIPFRFEGFGYSDDGYALKHWYPSPIIYSNHRWQDVPYMGESILYNEMGKTDVTLTVAKKFMVTVNGMAVDSAQHDSLKVFHFTTVNGNGISSNIQKRNLNPKTPSPKFPQLSVCRALDRVAAHKILPAVGYNEYDGFQLGIVAQNLHDSAKRLSYAVAPMYAFNSKTVTGIADVQYRFHPRMYAGVTTATFSVFEGTNAQDKKIFGEMYKLAPYFRYSFPSSPKINQWLEYRLFLIGERVIDYVTAGPDEPYYPQKGKLQSRYLNQLTFNHSSSRVLYPYQANVQLEQAEHFYRLNITGKYFFNYANGGGLRVRVFASKFGYLGNPSSLGKLYTLRYQPKLTAITGAEDYTYSNYFIARNNFGSFDNQVMMRDGGLKLRTDRFDGLQGRSDNWIASMNLNTTLPQLTPIKIPLRVFVDAGTYAEAWHKDFEHPRFLYVAGLQLSLLNEVVNIYAPVLCSGFFRDQLKTVPEENKFFNRISFSIDVQRINFRKSFCRKKIW